MEESGTRLLLVAGLWLMTKSAVSAQPAPGKLLFVIVLHQELLAWLSKVLSRTYLDELINYYMLEFNTIGIHPTDAILSVLTKMTEKIPNADGGVIGISKDGTVGFNWNSEQMAWAYIQTDVIHAGIQKTGMNYTEPWNSLAGPS